MHLSPGVDEDAIWRQDLLIINAGSQEPKGRQRCSLAKGRLHVSHFQASYECESAERSLKSACFPCIRHALRNAQINAPSVGDGILPKSLLKVQLHSSHSSAPVNRDKARTKSECTTAAAWKAYGSPKVRGFPRVAAAPLEAMMMGRASPPRSSSVVDAVPGSTSPLPTPGEAGKPASPYLRPQTAPVYSSRQQHQSVAGPRLDAPPAMHRVRPVTAAQRLPIPGSSGPRHEDEDWR